MDLSQGEVEIEFEVASRTYRTSVRYYAGVLHGLNDQTSKVSIITDANTGEKVFVNWSQISAIRILKDSPK